MDNRKFFIPAGVFLLAWAAAGISFATEAPTVTKTVAPSVVNVGDEFTITLKVKGAGGSSATPMDVVFALDSSGSMQSNDPGNQRIIASQAFLGFMIMPPDQAGVVSWDTGIDFTLPLTGVPATVSANLLNVDSSGGTNLDVGLRASLDLLAPFYPASSPSRKCAVIFLTDGSGSYTMSGGSNSQADRSLGMGCTIYAIGYGPYAQMGPLEDMADTTGGKFYPNSTYPVVDPSTINLIFQDIYKEINTVPYNVAVQDTVQDYIEIIPGSCNEAPDYGPVSGRVIWDDIGTFADGDSGFPANETVTLTCDARCTEDGVNKPVDILADSYVAYEDNNGENYGEVGIPQAYITCKGNKPPVTTEAYASTDCFRTRLPGYADHRLEEINIEGVTDPDGDQVTIEITGITSDEPITSGGCADARISSDADTAMLRIERYGRNGRVYEISFTASDGQAESQGSVQVVVPYDDNALPPRYSCDEVIDDGQSFDATNEAACLPRIKPPYFPAGY
jgi:hypothetical protein